LNADKPSFDRIDLERLSPQSRWALEHLAVPHRLDEVELADLAATHELSLRVVKRMLSALDAEVRAQQVGAELPELARSELQALELQLLRWGQIYPIVRAIVGKHRTAVIVDGANRERLLEDLELPVSYTDIEVESNAEARELGLALNLARRHLDVKRIRSIASSEILHNPKRSDRAIADAIGVSRMTVGRARRELEKLGVVSHGDTRVGSDGVEQPIRASAIPQAPRREEKLTAILGELRDLAKSDERGIAHVRADALVVDALRLLGADALAETFERIVGRT
jgi:DNA-binding Lrp family transcriptional regulator